METNPKRDMFAQYGAWTYLNARDVGFAKL
jgi:hypothetical protein